MNKHEFATKWSGRVVPVGEAAEDLGVSLYDFVLYLATFSPEKDDVNLSVVELDYIMRNWVWDS